MSGTTVVPPIPYSEPFLDDIGLINPVWSQWLQSVYIRLGQSIAYPNNLLIANPMTTLGDTLYENSSLLIDRVAGNITATKKFYNQTGTGIVSASPQWNALTLADLPASSSVPASNTFAGWDANKNLSAVNLIDGYTTTPTAAATTTLVVGSNSYQYFTGSTTQIVSMPVASTLALGMEWTIVNLSSGTVTVKSSGANTIQAMVQNSQLVLTCILISGTGTASWNWTYSATQAALPVNGITTLTGDVTATGSGSVTATLAATTNATLATLSALVSVGTITTGTWNATTVATNHGGTGQTSVITAPTATTYAGWDASKNFSGNAFIPAFTTTATAAATTTMTIASTQTQVWTGSSTQTVKLPTTSVVAGGQYLIINLSSGNVTVQSSGANTIQVLAASSQGVFTSVVATPTGAADWNCCYQVLAGGSSAGPRSEVWVYTAGGWGATNTCIRYFNTVGKNTGSDITYASSATNGDSWTINTAGVYSIAYQDNLLGNAVFGISLNSAQLTTAMNSITAANRLGATSCLSANANGEVSFCTILAVNDVIRAHGDGTASGVYTNTQYFRITKVAS